MSSKIAIIFCTQALLAQVTYSQCAQSCGENTRNVIAPSVSSCGAQTASGSVFSSGLSNGARIGNGAGLGIGASVGSGIEVVSSSGGAFPVYSAASIAPRGISVSSENAYEGSLNIIGELPFLSAIGFEGVLPSTGAGNVHYGCGNGVTAITSEISNAAGATGIGSADIGSRAAGYGFGLEGSRINALNQGHVTGRHCGCGLY